MSRCEEAEVEIQELEDELKIVGQNMKTLELSETDALARQEKFEETIRGLAANLKVNCLGWRYYGTIGYMTISLPLPSSIDLILRGRQRGR